MRSSGPESCAAQVKTERLEILKLEKPMVRNPSRLLFYSVPELFQVMDLLLPPVDARFLRHPTILPDPKTCAGDSVLKLWALGPGYVKHGL